MGKRLRNTGLVKQNCERYWQVGQVGRVRHQPDQSTRPTCLSGLLPRDHEMTAPVLLPAGLFLLAAERLLLALADDRHARRRDAEAYEVVLDGDGAARA